MKRRLSRSSNPCYLVFATLIASVCLGGPARAADTKPASEGGVTTDNRALAEVLFFTARGMMEAHRYPEACQKLAESYRLDPAAGTLLNLAVCHEKQGRIASAWGEFTQSATDAKHANRPDREELAREHIAALEPDLPMMAIDVPATVKVAGLELVRNGVTLSAAAWDTELPVDPGEVEIVSRAPGYLPFTLKVKIEKRQHLKVSLQPLELAPLAPQDVVFWTPKRKVGAAVGVVGIAAVAVGTVVGLGVLDNRQKSDAACPSIDGHLRCTSEGADAMSKAHTGAWISDIAFGVGAVAVATSVYLFVTGSQERAEPTPPKSTAWTFRVNASPLGARGVVEGRF